MKKINIALLAVTVFIGSCTKDITHLNEDPINPSVVPSYSLVTNAERSLARTMASSNVNLNVFRLIVQYWQEVTYTAESRYNLNSRNIPSNLWTAMYRDVLRDLQEAKTTIAKDVKNAGTQKNQLAIVDILQVYTYYYLVTTYGNIPYTEALDINNAFPKFDDQKTVYYDLLTRLDADIAALNTGEGSFGSAEIIYGGDVAKWKKFANSLKLKMGMTIADSDAAKSRSVVESAYAGGVFESNADNAIFQFLSAPPNTNPIWEDLVQSGRKDFVANTSIIDTMLATNDPRLPFYFTLNPDNTYSGSGPGRGTTYSLHSKPSGPLLVAGSTGKITNPDFPVWLLTYSEVEFFLAEAKERPGYNIPGTAKSHYDAAVTASIKEWGGTDAQAIAYLANPQVLYSSANWQQKIGIQKWLSLYNRGWDAWIEWRRLDYPRLQKAFRAVSDIPVRFTYPVNEQNYNTSNYNEAATAIGGDVVTTRLFWDVK